MGDLLEIAAHGVTAILATWLGILVLTRAQDVRGSRVFGFLCALLVLWSTSIIVQRTTGDPSVVPPANILEDIAAWLLPPATAHIGFLIAGEGRPSRSARLVLTVAYGIAAAAILQAVVDPIHPIAFDEPNFEPFGIDGLAVAWVLAGVRLAIFALAIGYLVSALRDAAADRVRRRQLVVALATVVIGVVGGMARILPPEIGGPRWVGVSLVSVAIVLATYAVVSQHVFLAADAASRAVRGSLAAGIGIVVYVALILIVDQALARALAIELPIVMSLALVVTIAVIDPIARSFRERGRSRGGNPDEARLLVALGADSLLAQEPDGALVPALERLVRTFDLRGAAVLDAEGRPMAVAGAADGAELDRGLRLPLGGERGDGRSRGSAVFVPRSDESFTPAELAALRLASTFLGASLRLADRQREQAAAIAGLRDEREAVANQGSALDSVLEGARSDDHRLRVFALGPLRAERDGEPIRRWGGEKAGSRQAEAIFALLFDRGERGISKDEILEIVWPDVDLDRADVAFHRTMLGLRATLRPGRRSRRASSEPIVFHSDRYRIERGVVSWTDVAEFERLVGGAASDAPDGITLLEQARALYRGDYLDDVPYVGDSAAVEDRRVQLRRGFRDLLLELAARYEARGDALPAAACRRQAATVDDDAIPDALPLRAGQEPA